MSQGPPNLPFKQVPGSIKDFFGRGKAEAYVDGVHTCALHVWYEVGKSIARLLLARPTDGVRRGAYGLFADQLDVTLVGPDQHG